MLSKYLISTLCTKAELLWHYLLAEAVGHVARVLQVHGVVWPRAPRVPAPAGCARLTQAPPLARVGAGYGHPIVICIHISPSLSWTKWHVSHLLHKFFIIGGYYYVFMYDEEKYMRTPQSYINTWTYSLHWFCVRKLFSFLCGCYLHLANQIYVDEYRI